MGQEQIAELAFHRERGVPHESETPPHEPAGAPQVQHCAPGGKLDWGFLDAVQLEEAYTWEVGLWVQEEAAPVISKNKQTNKHSYLSQGFLESLPL